MDTFKFKITLDRHNAIHNLNYYDLPDPPRFSLPSTFKNFKKKPGFQYFTADQMSLVSIPSSNGWIIPLTALTEPQMAD
jgi:hypothetical protein